MTSPSLEIHRIRFSSRGPHDEDMRDDNVAALPVISLGGGRYVASAHDAQFYEQAYEEARERYGEGAIKYNRSEDIRQLVLLGFLSLGEALPELNRTEGAFAGIAPAHIFLIKLENFLERDMAVVKKDEVILSGVTERTSAQRVVDAYKKITKSRGIDSTVRRTFSNITV